MVAGRTLSLAVLAALLGCGARTPLPEDRDLFDGGAFDAKRDVAGGAPESGPAGDAQWDASLHDIHNDSSGDSAQPLTCDDIGKFPGLAMCCGGAYCAGGCLPDDDPNGVCVCQPNDEGCPNPLRCCLNGCVADALCIW